MWLSHPSDVAVVFWFRWLLWPPICCTSNFISQRQTTVSVVCLCMLISLNTPAFGSNFLRKIRYGQPIKVNWAYTSTQREDTSGLELKYVYIIFYLLLLSSVMQVYRCEFMFLNFNDKLWLRIFCAGHFNIFVGDLCPEITDAALFAFFSAYSTCS